MFCRQSRVRQFRGESYGWHIVAARQSVGCADRPEKFPIEIIRVVIPKAARRVLQQGKRMNAPLIERERVNKRLQRRARRARTSRTIDLSLNFFIRKIGGTDIRENFHALEIDQQRRGVFDSALAILRDVIGDAPF